MKLNEMNILITGANGFLASNLIKYFSKKAAFVVGTVRNLATISKLKNNEIIIEMDPLNIHSIEEAISWVNNESGNIHVWMNIIGGFIMGNHVEEGHDDWTYMYNTNFMTALNCCKQILPHMKYNKCGHIINIGSQAAINGMPLAGAYSASKCCLHSLTKTIALENTDIACNAILPGILDSPENQKNMPNVNTSSWTSIKNITVTIEKLICSKKTGELIKI